MSAGDVVPSGGMLGFGARNAATSLLQTLAQDVMVLRMPSPPIGASDAEELGLGSPQFTDQAVQPVLVHQTGDKTLVTVSADVLEAVLGVSGADAVEAGLRGAAFALVGDRALQVDQVEQRAVFGRAYLYRILLVAPELR